MGVRTVRRKGQIVGYQAIGGQGRGGENRYFSLARYPDALRLACEAAAELERAHPPREYRAMRGNAGGLPGLRWEWRDSEAVDGAPILYVVATAHRTLTAYSTEKHGKLGAIELAIKRRESALGRSLGLTPRQALARMKPAGKV